MRPHGDGWSDLRIRVRLALHPARRASVSRPAAANVVLAIDLARVDFWRDLRAGDDPALALERAVTRACGVLGPILPLLPNARAEIRGALTDALALSRAGVLATAAGEPQQATTDTNRKRTPSEWLKAAKEKTFCTWEALAIDASVFRAELDGSPVSKDSVYRILGRKNVRDPAIRQALATLISKTLSEPCAADDLKWEPHDGEARPEKAANGTQPE